MTTDRPSALLPASYLNGRDILAMLTVTVFWAYNFIAAKYGVEHFQPLFFTALRFALLFALMAPFMRPVPRAQRKALASVAVCMGILHFAFIFTGLKLANNISAVAIVSQAQVPFSALFAMLFLRERVGWRRWSGIIVSFAGVALIGFDPRIVDDKLAVLLVLGGAIAFGFNTVISSTIKSVPVFSMQGWIALAAAPGLFLLSLIFEDGHQFAMETAEWLDWGAVIFSCVGASVIGHGIIYTLLRRYPVSVVAPWTLLSPLLAVVFGVWLWGDQITWRLLVGGAMTLGGVAVITVRAAKVGKLPVPVEPAP